MKWNDLMDDLRESPLRSFLMFLQLFAAVCLVTLAVTQSFHINHYKEVLTGLSKYEQLYFLRDRTDNVIFHTNIMGSPDAIPRMSRLYTYLTNHPGFESYSFYHTEEQAEREGETEELSLLHVNENFWNLYRLNTEHGGSVFEGENQRDGAYTPVVLGSALKERYRVGDVIQEKYLVRDFLEKGLFYLNPGASSEVYSLDSVVVLPIRLTPSSDFSEYDMAINSTAIATGDPAVFDEIQQKSNELRLFTFTFESYSRQLQNIVEESRFETELTVTILTLLLCLSSLGMVAGILEYITSHQREFMIHILCGATRGAVLLRVLSQVMLFLLLSNLLALLIWRSPGAFLITLLFSAALGAAVSVVPCVRLMKLDLNAALRKE